MRAATISLLVMASGCFSWGQQDPPPRARWNDPVVHRCDGRRTAVVAAVAAGFTLGAATVIFARTEDNLEYIEERTWGGILALLGIGWSLDAMNALSDGGECNAYRRHVARRGA